MQACYSITDVIPYFGRFAHADHAADEYPDQLQDVKFPLITDVDCADDDEIDAAGGIENDIMLCAGYPSAYITICSVSASETLLQGAAVRNIRL